MIYFFIFDNSLYFVTLMKAGFETNIEKKLRNESLPNATIYRLQIDQIIQSIRVFYKILRNLVNNIVMNRLKLLLNLRLHFDRNI